VWFSGVVPRGACQKLAPTRNVFNGNLADNIQAQVGNNNPGTPLEIRFFYAPGLSIGSISVVCQLVYNNCPELCLSFITTK